MLDRSTEKFNYLQRTLELYRLNELSNPVGSSVEEVEKIEDKLGFRFPVAFFQYLRFMGNDLDGIFEEQIDCLRT